MTDIGELVVRIRADAAQLEREMRKANGVVKDASGGMTSSLKEVRAQFAALLPAIGVAAVAEFGRRAFLAADQINDLAQRIGFAGSTLSALNIPLKQSGSSLEEFSASMNRMNNAIGEAAKGLSAEAIKSFNDLGLSVAKLAAMSPEDQFFEIAGALGKMENQAQMTNAGMAIFGRGFASIIPLIKQSGRNLREFTEDAQNLGNALTDDQLKRIDELGDRWTAALERMKLAALEVVPLLETIASVPDYVRAILIEMPQQAGRGAVNYLKNGTLNPNVSSERPNTVGGASFVSGYSFDSKGNLVKSDPYGPKYTPPSARGSNAGLLRGKSDGATPLPEDYDTARSALEEFLDKQQEELALSGLTGVALAKERAVREANNAAMKDKVLLSPEMRAQIESDAEATYKLKEAQEAQNRAMQEAARFQQELHDKLSASLTDIAFKAGSATESMLAFAESIAKAAFEKKIAGPIADYLIGTDGKKGLLDDAIGGLSSSFGGFFADGGSPPVGRTSVVGERGPELFVPNTAGMIIPNHALGGGTTIAVTQIFQVSPGVPELVDMKLRQAAPIIAAQAQAGVLQGIQKGGLESRLLGKRS